jgi:dsRNA-specific ribonuclease
LSEQSERLVLEDIDITKALASLRHMVERDRAATPPENSKTRAKFARWEKDLKTVSSGVERIQTELIHQLDEKLGFSLDGRLLAVAMFQPSTKNLFLEIHAHYFQDAARVEDCEHAKTMMLLSELAKVLALVGDAALSMAVLHYLWRPTAREVGQLTERRAEIVSNQNLAEICDSWGLYQNRVHFDPPTATKSEIEHVKGTLLESVMGVLYLKHGLDGVRKVIGLLHR